MAGATCLCLQNGVSAAPVAIARVRRRPPRALAAATRATRGGRRKFRCAANSADGDSEPSNEDVVSESSDDGEMASEFTKVLRERQRKETAAITKRW